MKVGFALFDVSPFIYIGYNAAVYIVKNGDKEKIISVSKGLIENKIVQCYKFAGQTVDKIVPFFVYDGYAKWKNDLQGGTYKEGRTHIDPEIKSTLFDFIKTFGGYHLKNEEQEADDVLCSVKQKIISKLNKDEIQNCQFFIFTRDNDLLQLCDSKTIIYDPVKDGGVKDISYLKEKFGITNFKKIVLYKICFGDSSDKIDGIFKGRRRKPILAYIDEIKSYKDFYNWSEVKPLVEQAKRLESIIKLKSDCDFNKKFVDFTDYDRGFFKLVKFSERNFP